MNQKVKMKPSYLKIAFLDRDGTIIKDYPDEKWREIKEPEFLEGSIEGLKRLKEMGYDFIIITNQYLINDGIISLNDYQQFTGKFLKKLKEENIDILKIYFCPHNEKDHCHCKKPKPGMIEQAKKDFLIDMNNSIYIGDSQVDYLLAKHFNLTFYGINYNGDNVKSYRGILEISKQIKKIQNKWIFYKFSKAYSIASLTAPSLQLETTLYAFSWITFSALFGAKE